MAAAGTAMPRAVAVQAVAKGVTVVNKSSRVVHLRFGTTKKAVTQGASSVVNFTSATVVLSIYAAAETSDDKFYIIRQKSTYHPGTVVNVTDELVNAAKKAGEVVARLP